MGKRISIEYLKTLKSEMPELFDEKEPSTEWQKRFITVRIENPDTIKDKKSKSGTGSDKQLALAPDWEEASVTGEDIEDMIFDQSWSELFVPEITTHVKAPENEAVLTDFSGIEHCTGLAHNEKSPHLPAPDSMSFYLPFHFYYPHWWGVYLPVEHVLKLRDIICENTKPRLDKEQALEAARIFLYYHQAFHHKTECFITRLEATHRESLYKKRFWPNFQKINGTDKCLENGLANAKAIDDTIDKFKDCKKNLRSALAEYVSDTPPGDNQGNKIRSEYKDSRSKFAESSQQICLPGHPKLNPNVWRLITHMFTGFSNIKCPANYLIPKNSPIVKRIPLLSKIDDSE